MPCEANARLADDDGEKASVVCKIDDFSGVDVVSDKRGVKYLYRRGGSPPILREPDGLGIAIERHRRVCPFVAQRAPPKNYGDTAIACRAHDRSQRRLPTTVPRIEQRELRQLRGVWRRERFQEANILDDEFVEHISIAAAESSPSQRFQRRLRSRCC